MIRGSPSSTYGVTTRAALIRTPPPGHLLGKKEGEIGWKCIMVPTPLDPPRADSVHPRHRHPFGHLSDRLDDATEEVLLLDLTQEIMLGY